MGSPELCYLRMVLHCMIHHGPDLSSLPSPVSGRDGQPKRVGIVLWVLHLRECCGYLGLLGAPNRPFDPSVPSSLYLPYLMFPQVQLGDATVPPPHSKHRTSFSERGGKK